MEAGAPDRLPFVAVVAGPTASGKTRLAVAIALRAGGEIVNADSQQVYRGLDVGTAKPTPAERSAIPHHLLDLVEPGGGDGRRALGRARRRRHRGRGGAREAADRGGRHRSLRPGAAPRRRRGAGTRSGAADPARGGGGDRTGGPPCTGGSPRSTPGRPRASGRTTSSASSARSRSPPAAGRRASSSRRTASRLAATATACSPSTSRARSCTGASGSARRPWPAGASSRRPAHWWSASAEALPRLPIGYADAVACARGEIDREELAARIAQHHRRYARRQVIWLRREQDVEWLRPPFEPDALAQALRSAP